MYNFKYHPDNVILINQGEGQRPLAFSYADFMAANPNFPITEGEYFEYKIDGSIALIQGCSSIAVDDTEPYLDIINAINSLGE